MKRNPAINKGISVLILGFIVLSGLFIGIAAYRLVMHTETKNFLEALSMYMQYVDKSSSASLSVEINNGYVSITNTGPLPISLSEIFYEEEGRLVPLRLSPENSNCTSPLEPLQSCIINDKFVKVHSIVTSEGLVIKPEKQEVRVQGSYYVKMHHLTFNVNSAEDLSAVFMIPQSQVVIPYKDVPSINIARVVNSTITYFVERTEDFSNPTLNGSLVRFGALIVGRDPANPAKYNLLLVIPNNRSPGNSANLTINQYPLHFNTSAYDTEVLRIRVEGFSGAISIVNATSPGVSVACNTDCGRDALGTWFYGLTGNLSLNISGTANRVVAFRGINHTTAQQIINRTWNNFSPYLFVGDIDDNRLTDILFVTEDANYGNKTIVNDRNPALPQKMLVDYTVSPLRLYLNLSVLTGDPTGVIDGGEYQGLILYINSLFHDNVYPDEQVAPSPYSPKTNKTNYDIIDIRDIMRILLVDEHNNSYIVRTVSISELYAYHKTVITSPASDEYAWKTQITSYILLPGRGKYRVAVELLDPYHVEGTLNDADITIGLDVLTTLPLKR